MTKTQLRLAARKFEGFERSFSHQIDEFHRANPDVDVQAEFFELASLHDKMIGSKGAAKGEADLFLCVTDWLPEAVSEGLLHPLDEFVTSQPPEDWPDGWSPSMRSLEVGDDGRLYGLPYHDGPEIFLYRKDLFESPEEAAAFRARFGYDLAPPENWAEFLTVAKFFTRPEDGLWGACLGSYPDAHNNIYDFMIQLWSRGGELLSPAGEPLFDSEMGRQALEYLHGLYHVHRVISPVCLELDSVASGMYYAGGNAAMMWNWSGFAAAAENPHLSKIVGKNGCSLIPAGDGHRGRRVSLNIYWILGITDGCPNKEAAYRFLRFLATPEMDKATSMLGGNGTRLSTWRDPEVREAFPYTIILEEAHRNVESPPRLAAFPSIAESLNKMVDDVLNERVDIDRALRRAAKEVEAKCASQLRT